MAEKIFSSTILINSFFFLSKSVSIINPFKRDNKLSLTTWLIKHVGWFLQKYYVTFFF